MNKSGIEWLYNGDEKGLTVNPVIGCSRISPGCGGGYIRGPNGESGGCWAETLVTTRMAKNPSLPMYKDLANGDKWSGVVHLMPERLKDIIALGSPRRKLPPSRVFVCDLSDLFHEKVPFEYIAAVFGAIACAPKHLFYVLTKRVERALEWAEWLRTHDDPGTLAEICRELAIDAGTEHGFATHTTTVFQFPIWRYPIIGWRGKR